MRKFTFRLDRVLEYRRQVEKERQIALTKTRQVVMELEQKLARANAILEATCDELRRNEGRGEIDIELSRQYRRYIGLLRRQASEMLKGLQAHERELALRREETVQAQKERKVLEMLKMRRHVEYLREARRFEQAELDDIATKKEAARRTVA